MYGEQFFESHMEIVRAETIKSNSFRQTQLVFPFVPEISIDVWIFENQLSHALTHSDINCTHESKDIKGDAVVKIKQNDKIFHQLLENLTSNRKSKQTEETEVFAIRPTDLDSSWFIYKN